MTKNEYYASVRSPIITQQTTHEAIVLIARLERDGLSILLTEIVSNGRNCVINMECKMTNKQELLDNFIDATLKMGEAHQKDIALMNDIIIADVRYMVENNITERGNHTPGSINERAIKIDHMNECKRLESIFHEAKFALFPPPVIETIAAFKLVLATGRVSSGTQAKNLIKGGGVVIDKKDVTNEMQLFPLYGIYYVCIGKKHDYLVADGIGYAAGCDEFLDLLKKWKEKL